MIPSFNVQLVNWDVNVVWTSPVIVAIRIVILDWVIYFFYLDVLLRHCVQILLLLLPGMLCRELASWCIYKPSEYL